MTSQTARPAGTMPETQSLDYLRLVPSRTRTVLRGVMAAAGALAAIPLLALLASCSGGGDLGGAASSVASRVSEAGSGLPSVTGSREPGPTDPGSPTSPTATSPVESTSRPSTVTQTSEVTRTATETATTIRTETATATATVTPPSPTPSAQASRTAETVAVEETAWYASPWVWLLLLLAAVLVAVVVSAARRSSTRGRWDQSLADVTADAYWLADTFTANLLAQSNPNTVQSVLVTGLPRFDDADQKLMQLASSAPDETRRGHATGIRSALGELRQSLQHVADLAITGAPADTQRQAAGLVQQSQAQLRASLSTGAAPEPPA